MSSSSDNNNNAGVIKRAERLQRDTRESLRRIQQQTEQAEEIGGMTLSELRNQRQQLDDIDAEEQRMKEGLRETKRLQNTFDRWAFNWGGYKKKEAKRIGKADVQAIVRESRRKQRERKEEETEESSPPLQIQEQQDDMEEWNQLRDEGKKRSRGVQKKNLLPAEYDHIDSSEAVGLSEEDKAGLEGLETGDEEIDEMLDEVANSLDRLGSLSVAMGEEAKQHSSQLEGITASAEETQLKQATVINRVKLNLVGRFRNRSEKDKE